MSTLAENIWYSLFLAEPHFDHSYIGNQLIPLGIRIHSSRDPVRKVRESHLVDKAMTLKPNGLNCRDEV